MRRENTNDRIKESSLHFARQVAGYVRRSPQSLAWEWQGDPNGYGSSVLVLEYGTSDLLMETRTLYGDMLDAEQQHAILRAAQWKMDDAYKSITKQGDAFVLNMPARYVVVPVKTMVDWLSMFANLSVQVNLISDADRTMGVRRLRIQQDFVTHAFERAWEGDRIENHELNQRWNRVWDLMTEALSAEPTIDTFRESFWGDTSRVKYDLERYMPTRLHPAA
jgi:hypothetical protein